MSGIQDADASQSESRDEQVGCQLPHIGDGDNGLVWIDRLRMVVGRCKHLPRGESCLRGCSQLWVDRTPWVTGRMCFSLAFAPDCRGWSGLVGVVNVSGSISDSTPACHAGERGSTPRQRDSFLRLFLSYFRNDFAFQSPHHQNVHGLPSFYVLRGQVQVSSLFVTGLVDLFSLRV